MVLGGHSPGRVGRRRVLSQTTPAATAGVVAFATNYRYPASHPTGSSVAERPPRRRRDDNDDDRPRPRRVPALPAWSRRAAATKGCDPSGSGRPPQRRRPSAPRPDDDRPARGRPPAAGKRAPRRDRDDDRPARGRRAPAARQGRGRPAGRQPPRRRAPRAADRSATRSRVDAARAAPRAARPAAASSTRRGVPCAADVESEAVPKPKRPVLRTGQERGACAQVQAAGSHFQGTGPAATPPAALDRGRRRTGADRGSRRDPRPGSTRQGGRGVHGRDASATRRASCARCGTLTPTRPRYASCSASCTTGSASTRPRAKELTAFADLTGSVEQHPVLMDCWRAQHRYTQGRRAVARARQRRRHQRRS